MLEEQEIISLEQGPYILLNNWAKRINLRENIYQAMVCVYKISIHEEPLKNWRKMHRHMVQDHVVCRLKKYNVLYCQQWIPPNVRVSLYHDYFPYTLLYSWNVDPKIRSLVKSILDSWVNESFFFFKYNPARVSKGKQLKQINRSV